MNTIVKRMLAPAFGCLVAFAACGDAVDSSSENMNELACPGEEAEDNGTESRALRLETTDDCDGNGGDAQGVLAGKGDADWYYFEAFDVPYCIVNPAVALESESPGLRVCTFFRCLDGEATISCPSGSVAEKSADGLVGCCSDSVFPKLRPNCDWNGTEDIDVYVRVDQPNAPADSCYDYSFRYHY